MQHMLPKAVFLASGDSLWEKFVTWYQETALYELLQFLGERFFTVDFGVYENFSIGVGTGQTIQTLIIAMAIGIVLATGMMAHTRTKLGGFVRLLVREDCLSPDRAKTLSELGLFRNAAIRRELSRGVTLRKVVKCREEEEFVASARQSATPVESEPGTADAIAAPAEEGREEATAAPANANPSKKSAEPPAYRIDFTTAHFYIPEDLKYRAEVRFRHNGSTWGLFFVTLPVVIVLAALVCTFLPELLQMTDNLISYLGS